MTDTPNARTHVPPEPHRLLAYVADLELEVDRLRKLSGFMRHKMGEGLKRIPGLCTDTPDGSEVRSETASAVRELVAVLWDLRDTAGYHPAHDQVVAIAVRPLVEQVFRWQQLTGHQEVALRLELEVDYVEWFPARLRHILDNLISNALRYRDPVKAEPWVFLGLHATDGGYEFRLSDNGMGLPEGEGRRGFELLSQQPRSGRPGSGSACRWSDCWWSRAGGLWQCGPRTVGDGLPPHPSAVRR